MRERPVSKECESLDCRLCKEQHRDPRKSCYCNHESCHPKKAAEPDVSDQSDQSKLLNTQ